MGQEVVILDPFGEQSDALNPMEAIVFLIICAMIMVPLTGGLAALLLRPVAMAWGVIAAMLSRPGSKIAS